MAIHVEQVPPLASDSLTDQEGLLASQGVRPRKARGVELHKLHACQLGLSTRSHGLPVPCCYSWICGSWEDLCTAAGELGSWSQAAMVRLAFLNFLARPHGHKQHR